VVSKKETAQTSSQKQPRKKTRRKQESSAKKTTNLKINFQAMYIYIAEVLNKGLNFYPKASSMHHFLK
jgi:hypothetical protein